MKAIALLPCMLFLFLFQPLQSAMPPEDSGPGKVGTDPKSSEDTLTVPQDSLTGRWWTTLNPNHGILPQPDTSRLHAQQPVAYACANESGMTSNFFIYDERPAIFTNREEIMKIMAYPQDLKDHWIEGRVLVDVNVDKTGKVIAFVITFGTHSMMKMAVMDVVFDMKFLPAIQAGKPVDSWVTVPIWFEMSNQKYEP